MQSDISNIERPRGFADGYGRTSFEHMARRLESARASAIRAFMDNGAMDEAEAEKVLALYKKHRLVRMDAVMGTFRVVHGGLLDRATLQRALAQA